MPCPNCGAANRPGSKFCSDCGSPLARICAHCSTPLRPGARYCDECGLQLGGVQSPGRPDSAADGQRPAERRIVSVLFADLVGFTSLAEGRDAEDVRELLGRYFEICRALVDRYGGTVEKFIGDAVMAVWGAPTAHEDDAERAVRAALDVVDAVATLSPEAGSALRARAGVLTGEAAVTPNAQGYGIVAGDLVNTASRIQGEAAPGTVLVGEATRRATEAGVVYEDAGEHTLKGKAEPVRLWRATRVIGGRGGALRSEALEAPFVGRDRDLRLIKELFHAGAEQRRAHLVSVVGIAGVGKSRLIWEFFKYLDGVAEEVFWHRGRCLAYGEGVAYSALAEMVRMRAGIAEGEEASEGRRKLAGCLDEIVADPGERRWVEPRLTHLLGLEGSGDHDRQDLFGAWRLFFERLADTSPTVLVFDDLQWADSSLLEFIDHLMRWSRNHPLFVVTTARPELHDRHPRWGAGERNFTSIQLEPLPPSAVERLVDGLVPGLPDEVREQLLRHSEGVPLYTVETVRMLLDRGLITASGNIYRITGSTQEIAVPQSLHGLIAARLDSLDPAARRLLQDAAVIGRTFTASALAAVSGVSGGPLESLLGELVAKELLSRNTDARSPERGQYSFVQDLVRRVAYETLSRRDRKEKHLAVASWLESTRGPEDAEVVEIVASHYLEAHRLAPADPDAARIKERATEALVTAGERAGSLAASSEAERYFEMAASLAASPAAEAALHERAGHIAGRALRADAALGHYRRAMTLYEEQGLVHAAARASAFLGRVMGTRGQSDQAIERMERGFQVIENDPPDADLATLAEALGTLYFFTGNTAMASHRIDKALDIAESLRLPEVISRGLNTKALIALRRRHPEECLALMTHARQVALANDLPGAVLRASYNLATALVHLDRFADALTLYRDAQALARKVGDRRYEMGVTAESVFILALTGEWDRALAIAESVSDAEAEESLHESQPLLMAVAEIEAHRGNAGAVERAMLAQDRLRDSSDIQERSGYWLVRSAWLQTVGRVPEALEAAQGVLQLGAELPEAQECIRLGFPRAMESALALGDTATATRLLERVERMTPVERFPFLSAHAARFRARLALLTGEDGPGVEATFREAEETFGRIGAGFWLAVTRLELAEVLGTGGDGTAAHTLGREALDVFANLGARPWEDRARGLLGVELSGSRSTSPAPAATISVGG
ncbi:MAG TPA: adenylate/guanylate cyclase domain-containing protein [Candidatus Binatia bacterium]|nr:adenylate/guanylate cyclase domain-containing protein [Candidatus Binatia bacterium]